MRWIVCVSLLVLTACATKDKELYRPTYHFTPDHNWTNDPNGLLYANGEYHLFYQYNPFGNRWGHMSWGHAVSPDLIRWEHLPVAINEYTDANGDSVMIFSGSAVATDTAIVAIYTSHVHKNGEGLKQHQSIASSTDNGRKFTRYQNNPVLDINRKDFRDPKVSWYDPQKKWVMAAVIPDKHKVQLYESRDLKAWQLLSEFGPLGDTTKIWECPDLFPTAIENDPSKTKWVMIVSNSHPQGGPYVGMQYFIGDFDGTKFVADSPGQYPLYVDYGKDFYAGVTFNNAPGERPVLLGWVNNWAYANELPTSPWKGAMSLPRELSLFDNGEGLRLRQVPIKGIEGLKGEIVDKNRPGSRSLFIDMTFEPGDSIGKSGIDLFESFVVGFDASTDEVFVDRTGVDNIAVHEKFPGIERAPARRIDGKVRVAIYIDESIIELYVNNGEAVITDQFFPATRSTEIAPWVEGRAEVPPNEWKVWKMKGAADH